MDGQRARGGRPVSTTERVFSVHNEAHKGGLQGEACAKVTGMISYGYLTVLSDRAVGTYSSCVITGFTAPGTVLYSIVYD